MSSENKKQYYIRYENIIDSKYSLPIALGCLSIATIAFTKKTQALSYLRQFTRNLNSIETQTNLSSHSAFKPQYITGKLKYNKTIQVKDNLYGVKLNNEQGMGLYRKTEVFNKDNKNEIGEWKNFENQNEFFKEKYSYLKSITYTKGEIYIDNQKLSNNLIDQIGSNYSTPLKINFKDIETYVAEMEVKYNDFMDKVDSGESDMTEHDKNFKDYGQFPDQYSQDTNRKVHYDDEYIYICEDALTFKEGDVRISWNEIKNIAEVTLLAGKMENLITHYEIPELIQRQLKYEVIIGDKPQQINLGMINFIKSGILSKQQFIKLITSQIEGDAKYQSLLYALAIYLIYLYFTYQVGDIKSAGDSSYQRVIDTQNNNKIFRLYNDILSVNQPKFHTAPFEAGLLTSWHLFCNFLFIKGKFSFLLGATPLFFYLLASIEGKLEYDRYVKKQAELQIDILNEYQNNQSEIENKLKTLQKN